MIMERKDNERIIRLGIIGCGRISKNHFDAVFSLKDRYKLVSICDIDKAKLESFKETYKDEGLNTNCYTDYEEMLNKEQMDLISICTPSGLHPENGILAANKKINVLTEKPMAVNLKDADKLIYECSQNGVSLFVVKQNRLNKTVQYLKKAIETGRFGKIYQVNINVFWSRPQSYYDSASWRGTWKYDGGAFLNQASHYVDLLHYLFGNIKSVFAQTKVLARKIETEDSGAALFEFENGILATMNVSMLVYPKNYEGSITIIGEKGTVKVGGIAINKIEHWEFQEYHDDDKEIEALNTNPPTVYGFGHLGFYVKVSDSLRGKDSKFVDGFEGRKSLEIIMGIYRSSAEERKVFF